LPVPEAGVESDRLVGGKGPWSCGPKDQGCPLGGQRKFPLRIRDRKLNIDRRRSMIFIFYFRLGQGRMAGGAPVDRLFLAVKRGGGDELSQFPDRCRLVNGIARARGV